MTNDETKDTVIETANEEKTVSEEQYARLMADVQNVRRAAATDAERAGKRGRAVVLESLLPVADYWRMALSHVPASDESWRANLDVVVERLEAALAALGVRPAATVGEPFDPNRHEAIERRGEGDAVVEIRQQGYLDGDALLYPARVAIGTLESSRATEQQRGSREISPN